jgi:hypothetical protein
MTFVILGTTVSYVAAAPKRSEIVVRHLLAPNETDARERAWPDLMDHGLNRESARSR